MMTRGGAIALMIVATGCSPQASERSDQFVGVGQVMDAQGAPVTDRTVAVYHLDLTIAGDGGPTTIAQSFRADREGRPMVTDQEGVFHVAADDLDLSYAWERDEEVCSDVCVAWDTVCDTVTEEVCLDTCYEDDCYDECWDSCDTECFDERFCDDDGCWTETVCEDVCTEVCEPVCDTVAYDCNCYLDSYDVCSDVCVASTPSCEWVTRTYTSTARLDQVTASHVQISVDGLPLDGATVDTALQAGPSDDLWVQKDRFTLP